MKSHLLLYILCLSLRVKLGIFTSGQKRMERTGNGSTDPERSDDLYLRVRLSLRLLQNVVFITLLGGHTCRGRIGTSKSVKGSVTRPLLTSRVVRLYG